MTGFCTWRGVYSDPETPGALPLIMSIIGSMGIRFKPVPGSFSLAHPQGKDAIAARVAREDMDHLRAEKPRIMAWLASRPLIYMVPDEKIPVAAPHPHDWQELAARIGIQWAVPGVTDWLYSQAAEYAVAFPAWEKEDCMRAAFRDLDQWQKGEGEL